MNEELSKVPFVPLRLHLTSGKTIEVIAPDDAWMLNASVMVFQERVVRRDDVRRYDTVSLTHIERIEQLP
jgi:hypothetical protein